MAADLKSIVPYTERDAWLTELYKNVFPSVAKYIGRRGGSLDEARDIFQDAIVIYYEKSLLQQLNLKYGDKAYLFGISRHLWSKRYRESINQESIDGLGLDFDEQAGIFNAVDQQICSSRLFQLLQMAGQKCMDLLSAFYYEKLSMEEVAVRFGFSGPHSATVQKFKCLKKIKETVKEKSIQYEDIFE